MLSRPQRLTLSLALLLLATSSAQARQADTADLDLSLPALLVQLLHTATRPLVNWYERTPAIERVAWGGLAACAILATLTFLDRYFRTRPPKIVPTGYSERLHTRLLDGRLDWHQAVDYAEMNPSPASRVALAALRRAGRPSPEIERGVALTLRAESNNLHRHLATLRRVACLAPLVGLLGSLGMIHGGLATLGPDASWRIIVAHALLPLIAAVGLAILALVSYDGLSSRADGLSADLERIGAELVDHLAVSTGSPNRPQAVHAAHPSPAPHPAQAATQRPNREV